MIVKEHFRRMFDLYTMLVTWAIVGTVAPELIAVGYSVVTFILILRTRDLTKILLAFTAMLIFSDSRSDIFSFAATAKIGVVLSILIFVLSHWNDFKDSKNKLFVFFLPFLIFSLVATIWATETFTAFQKSVSYGLIFFIVPSIFLKAEDQNEKLGRDLLLFFSILLTSGLLIFALNPDFALLEGRYRGLLGNPNGLGIFLTVVFSIYFLINRRNSVGFVDAPWKKIFLIVFFISLLLTGSRTSLFAILIFLLFNQLRYLSNAFTLVVFALLIVGYEYLLAQLPLIIEFLGLAEYFRLDTLEEGSGRFVAWSFAWQRIQEVFFAGGGFGYTEYIYKTYFAELSRLGHQGNAHNSYLTIWLDTGLIGLSLFVVGLVRSVFASIKESPYALPIIYSILFSSYFESWLSASLNPFTSLFIISLTILIHPLERAEA